MSSVSDTSYKLPAEAYYDPAWFEREKRNIFGNSWLFAGLESELTGPGCYKTLSAGFDELVLVRDRTGTLNAYHNTCRHRGARLVEGTGKCGSFVCPYHKWGYGFDGKLRGVPKREQFTKLNFEELGLHSASVESWMGLMFVHVDEFPAVNFDKWATGIANELAPFKADKLQLLRQESFTFDANWKLYIENHIDWLHLWYVHPKTLGAYLHESGRVMQFGSSFCSYEPVKPEFEELVRKANPLPIIPYIEDLDQRYSEVGAHFLFPNLPLFTGSSFFAIAELTPLTPEKTQMSVSLLGIPGGDTDAFMTSFNAITKDEDVAIITNIQQNIRSSRFKVGPLAHTYESAISSFHDHYLSLIDKQSDVSFIRAL